MPVSSSTEHWIKPDALTINLNHFGDPDYLQVSVLAGAVIMAFKQDVIGYNAAHNYRTWPLNAANTYLETTSAYNVYARLTRSEVNARALVIYDPVLRDIEGREITYVTDEETGKDTEHLGEVSEDYYYIFLGKISSSVSESGSSILREWESDYRSGTLETNQQQNDLYGMLGKMFRPHYDDPLDPDKLTWIEALTDLGVDGGITSFIENEKFDLPGIYDGLPIDNQTLHWEETTNEDGSVTRVLKARGGSGEGTISDISITGSGNAITNVSLNSDKTGLIFSKELEFALKTDFDTTKKKLDDFLEGSDTDTIINKWKELEAFLSGLAETDNLATILETKADKEYVDENFITKNDASSQFVTIGTPQTITGAKDFTGGVSVNGNPIVYDNEKGYWMLDGDLLVTGAVTMFANEGKYTPSTIMDALVLDSKTLKLHETTDASGNVVKQLTVIGGTGSGEGGSGTTTHKLYWTGFGGADSWDGSEEKVISLPGKLSELTNDTGFITSSSLSGYATEDWVNEKGFLTINETKILTFKSGTFTAVSFDASMADKTVYIPTKTSHLTNDSNYITSSALNGYATETWVGENFLPITGGQLQGDLRLRAGSEYYGRTLYFGDGSYAYISEDSDDHMLIYGNKGVDIEMGTSYYLEVTGKGIKLNGGILTYNSSSGYWELEGDLLVNGGITMI